MDLMLRATDALLVIDMQNDFMPGGPLGVNGGHEIISGINAVAGRFGHVILTQDWHPEQHISFASTHGKQPFTDSVEAPYGLQTLWPDHCLQGTHGAANVDGLDLPHAELVLRKGFRRGIDSYSAFLENDHQTGTGLAGYLRERQLTRLFFCGLAYDFCVGYSAVDGMQMGFESFVVEDLTRAVGLPGTVASTDKAFTDARIQKVRSGDILKN